jgi:hypothetical protein
MTETPVDGKNDNYQREDNVEFVIEYQIELAP